MKYIPMILFPLIVILAHAKDPQTIPIELPNQNEAIQLRSVALVAEEERLVIKGVLFKVKELLLPRSSHLHIDFVRSIPDGNAKQSDLLIARTLYQLRPRDFKNNRRIESFLKTIDTPPSDTARIVVEIFTQAHSDECGRSVSQ
jgi:hypothetical protein